jgi:predicted kinase
MGNRPTLWIDSDVARSVPKVRQLAELALAKGVKVVIHAQVHLEQCRQVRAEAARKGRPFSQERIQAFLDQLTIEVAEAMIDRATAEAWAELIHQRFPADDAWKRAKLDAVRARLPP